jgi:hypothetical protein
MDGSLVNPSLVGILNRSKKLSLEHDSLIEDFKGDGDPSIQARELPVNDYSVDQSKLFEGKRNSTKFNSIIPSTAQGTTRMTNRLNTG